MDDRQLVEALKSAGKTCFVRYFCRFSDESVSQHELFDLLIQENGYKEPATRSRVSNARRIIGAGRAKDALNLILRSKVDEKTKAEAARLRARLP